MYIKKEPIFYFLSFFASITAAVIKECYVDRGQNITLQCPLQNSRDITWIREGRKDEQRKRSSILSNGSLFLTKVNENDNGLYTCTKQNVVNEEKAHMKLFVRTPPPALKNVKIYPSTILAVIVWEPNGTGGYPIMNFTAQYRLAYTDNTWIAISPNHITPNSRQIDVYNLKPNTSYEFRIWATNQLGRGEKTSVIAVTKGVFTEEELARQLLAGAEDFDTRAWAVAVGIVMGTLVLLGLGVCFLLYQECRLPKVSEEQEVIELVPNIILNPGFDGNIGNETLPADENSNNETPIRLNNNTVVQRRQI